MSHLSPEYIPVLLDHCGQSVLAVEPETLKIVFANAEAGQLLECDPAQLLDLPVTQIETGISDHFFWEEVRAGTITDLPLAECLYRTQRGRDRVVEKSIHRRQVGDRSLYIVTARDISSSRVVEELSARTASLLAATFEATADGLLVTDPDGNIQNFNRRFSNLFHLPAELSLRGSDALIDARLRSQLVDPSVWDRILGCIRHNPESEICDALTLLDRRQIECVVRPQRLRGKTVGHVWCFSDVTAQVRYQSALLEARDAANSANRAKSQFLAAMSHELKTPLNAILGFAELIELDGYPGQAESVRLIRQAGSHLLELVNQVLDLARVDAGRLEVSLNPVTIPEVVDEVVEIMKPLALQARVTIEVQPGDADKVIADELRIRQMLLNLISNAIKYNRPDGWVRISHHGVGEADTRCFRIVVEDSGIGIQASDQGRIFEPFTRVGSESGLVEGTGLGLALTQRLAGLMNGAVGFTSVRGSGSVFWIELPAA